MIKKILCLSILYMSLTVQGSNFQDSSSCDSDDESFVQYQIAKKAPQPRPTSPTINFNMTTSSTTKPIIEAAELQAIRKRQREVEKAEPEKTTLATSSTIFSQLSQASIYNGKMHKGIAFDEFADKYPETTTSIIQIVQSSNILPHDEIDSIYDVIENHPHRRVIGNYKIVGEYPPTDGFREPLFNLEQAKEEQEDLVKHFINQNYSEVRARCIQPGLATTTSQEVWNPCMCGVQLHRSCYKQCYQNNVACCVNPYCQKPEGGSDSYSRNWTEKSYQTMLERKPKVPESEIKDESCLICFDSLKPKSKMGSVAASVALCIASSSSSSSSAYAISSDNFSDAPAIKYKKKRHLHKPTPEEV